MKPNHTFAQFLTLKTVSFSPDLVWHKCQDGEIRLAWGASTADLPKFRQEVSDSRKSVRSAYHEATCLARALRDACDPADFGLYGDDARSNVVSINLERFLEPISRFATRYGGLRSNIPRAQGEVRRISRELERRTLEGTIVDWFSELLTWLEVRDLSIAVVKRQEIRDLRTRVRVSPDGERIGFRTLGGENIRLANAGDEYTIRLPRESNDSIMKTYELAQNADSEQLAWIIMGQIVQIKLSGNLNLGVHPQSVSASSITPNGIMPTLYARAWLDVIEKISPDGLFKKCKLPTCENVIDPLESRSDKEFCCDAHRKKYRRDATRAT